MPAQRHLPTERGLVRAIGVRGLTANIVNSTVGAGIFVLPAVVASDLGTAAPLAYIACALVMALAVVSFAMAGSRVSLTGGLYAYVEVAFGPFLGFVTGFMVWFSCILASAFVASALTSALGTVAPAVGHGAGKAALLVTIYGMFAAVNIRSVAAGTRMVEVVTLAKLLPLALLLVVGVVHVRPTDLAITWAPPASIAATSMTLIFAFAGVEYALQPSGEVQSPARTVPRALLLALGMTTVLYLAVQLVAHAILGENMARFADAPLAAAAARVMGGWGGALMIAGGSISMLGALSGDALTMPRSLFAFARDGFVPAALARVHATHHTPVIAIVTHSLIVCTVAAVGSFDTLLRLSTTAMVFPYLLCCASAIELKRRDVRMNGEPFDPPGGYFLPVAACAVLFWLVLHASVAALQASVGMVACAAAVYGVREMRLRAAAAPKAVPEPNVP